MPYYAGETFSRVKLQLILQNIYYRSPQWITFAAIFHEWINVGK